MRFAAALALFLVSTVAAIGQDSAAGEVSFRKCLPCHAVGEAAKNKVGPVLNGLEGRKSGTIADYSYTQANKDAAIIWSEATFRDYIADPRAKIPGTKMVFAGIKSAQEANNLWTYLKQFGPDGKKK